MKRVLATIAGSALLLTTLAFVHPFGNPRLVPAVTGAALLQSANLPADAKKVLIAKCADCHSNETRWPAYARLAPGSWLIERDVVEARKKMNLSMWEAMPADTQAGLIGQMIHEAKNGDMPPLQYRFLHWDARLTSTDVAALLSMERAGQQELASGAAGDATHGKALFEKRCTGCHAIDGDREGPRLGGVFGRKAGSVAGFDYSAGLRNSGITWNDKTLAQWLENPDMLVPNNKMDFQVATPQDRSDLIAYFASQSNQH